MNFQENSPPEISELFSTIEAYKLYKKHTNEVHQQEYASLFEVSYLQRGDGNYIPHNIVEEGTEAKQLPNGLEVTFFKYAPNLEAHMKEADVIVSHAGSGSLFEALRRGKPLIAVPNSILMHNHQAELVRSDCLFCTPCVVFQGKSLVLSEDISIHSHPILVKGQLLRYKLPGMIKCQYPAISRKKIGLPGHAYCKFAFSFTQDSWYEVPEHPLMEERGFFRCFSSGHLCDRSDFA